MKITKASNTEINIITETTIKISLSQLKQRKEILDKQLAEAQARCDEVDKQIAKAEALGVKVESIIEK